MCNSNRSTFFYIKKKVDPPLVGGSYTTITEGSNLKDSGLSPFWVSGRRSFSFRTDGAKNNSLVIWGTNLSSSVGIGRITKQESNMIKLPSYQKSVIVGLLLSDGWLTIATKRSTNARLGFKQHSAKFTYVFYVFNLLSHYCSNLPYFTYSVRTSNIHYASGFFTRSLPCFTELHQSFYPNGIKIIPDNIYDILTPIALAHFIMGDGQTSHHGLVLCTNSFSILGVVKLMNVLLIRYGLQCNIREFRSNKKLEYMIYIRHGSMPLLRTIVKPFMHYSMLYKLNNTKAKDTIYINYQESS